jgi:hypothetical protein
VFRPPGFLLGRLARMMQGCVLIFGLPAEFFVAFQRLDVADGRSKPQDAGSSSAGPAAKSLAHWCVIPERSGLPIATRLSILISALLTSDPSFSALARIRDYLGMPTWV